MKSRSSHSAEKKPTDSFTLSVRIQPRASKNELLYQADGTLKIRLTAPPVDGAANEALIRFLSDRFSTPKSQIEIVSGHTGRDKIVRIHGKSEADAKRVLNSVE
jgi:hypothetical protein